MIFTSNNITFFSRLKPETTNPCRHPVSELTVPITTFTSILLPNTEYKNLKYNIYPLVTLIIRPPGIIHMRPLLLFVLNQYPF